MRFCQLIHVALLGAPLATAQDVTVEQVELALAALAINNTEDVRGNIYLPLSSNGLNITWRSSNTSVIADDGRVTRQVEHSDVNLTASIEIGGITRKRHISTIVPAAAVRSSFEGYAFAYFVGDSLAGENIYLAASTGNNALDWTELNGGQAVLSSSQGTRGLRDPFIIRSHEGDTFYLIATDLSIGSGTSWNDAVRTGSRYLEIWDSHNLVNWSAQRHVLVSPPTAGNTWAPEAFYDDELGAYLVYWASSLYDASDVEHTGTSYHRMLFATTRDFITFSEPQIWQDAGSSRIDSTVLKAGNLYHRFTKDEGAGSTGCADIIQESSAQLEDTLESWTVIATCIGAQAGTAAVEGPTAFKSNPDDVNGEKYYLFVDEYGRRGYIPLETQDIANPNWTVSQSYNLPGSPRHGTVLPVTAEELAVLTASFNKTN